MSRGPVSAAALSFSAENCHIPRPRAIGFFGSPRRKEATSRDILFSRLEAGSKIQYLLRIRIFDVISNQDTILTLNIDTEMEN